MGVMLSRASEGLPSIAPAKAVVLDTNVLVAGAFNRGSASSRLAAAVRRGELRCVWNRETQEECRWIFSRIRPLGWERVADLFQDASRYDAPIDIARYAQIPDRPDRVFAALAEATGAILITNDAHLLDFRRGSGRLVVLSPVEFLAAHPLGAERSDRRA
jgi:predicted nucleic acid-binding protein